MSEENFSSIYDQCPSIKICFLGDASVGKTSIINVIQKKDFPTEHATTVGACFYIRKIQVEDGSMVKMHIWDTAGQEKFRALTNSYFRDAQIVVLVYDITSEKSFQEMKKFYNDVQQYCLEDAKILIFANKTDLESERLVSKNDGETYAARVNAEFHEISALNMRDEVIGYIDNFTLKVLKQQNEVTPKDNVDLKKKKKSDKKCC